LEDPYTKYNARATHAALITPSNADAKDIFKRLLASIAASFMEEHQRDPNQKRVD
tara:strand:- start:747 stop:911 length:165 start_codon:yes stop_codon:yes gene_type:complete